MRRAALDALESTTVCPSRPARYRHSAKVSDLDGTPGSSATAPAALIQKRGAKAEPARLSGETATQLSEDTELPLGGS